MNSKGRRHLTRIVFEGCQAGRFLPQILRVLAVTFPIIPHYVTTGKFGPRMTSEWPTILPGTI